MHFPSLSQLVQALVRRPAPKACRRRTTRAAWSPLTALESRLLLSGTPVLDYFQTTEHVDLSIGHSFSANTWSLSVRDADDGISRSTDNALLYVGAAAAATRPASASFNFLGVGAGETFYQLTAAQNPDLLYLGLASYGVTPGQVDSYALNTESKQRVIGSARWLKMSLVTVEHFNPDGTVGTGKFSAWLNTGPTVLMASHNDGVNNPNANGLDATDGISADDALWVAAGGHNHFNFGFSAVGRYEVSVRLSGYFGDNGNVSTPNLAGFRQSDPIKIYFSVRNVGQLEFDTPTVTVAENVGNATLRVRRVGGTDGQLTVDFTTADFTANAGADYIGALGTLTFLDRQTEAFIPIPILDDSLQEPSETFKAGLYPPGPSNIADYISSPTGDNSSLLAATTATGVTITDNDAPQSSDIQIVAARVANGVVSIRYEVPGAAVAPFELGIYRSNDGTVDAADTLLATLTAPNTSVGIHSIHANIGTGVGEIPLPGAGAAELDTDYQLLVLADRTGAVAESSESNNTRHLTGAYVASGGILQFHGGAGPDNAVISSGGTFELNGVWQWTPTAGSFSSVRVRLQGGDDTLQASAFPLPLRIWGGEGNDSLVAGTAADTLEGGAGNDTLLGGTGDDWFVFTADAGLGTDTVDETAGGSDTLDFSSSTQGVTVDLAQTSTQVVNSHLSMVLAGPAQIENILGGQGADQLSGNSLANRLTGGPGNDSLAGAEGDDLYLFDADTALGSDTVNDTAGVDTLDFSATTGQAITLNLGLTTAQIVNANLTLSLASASAIENVTGGSLADTLTGNTLANVLVGGPGNDVLTGAAGNDVYQFDLDEILGADTLNEAGGGLDTLDFSPTTAGAATVNLALATIQTIAAGRLTLVLGSAATFENVIGSAGNDTLTGNTLDNLLIGGPGNDLLTGAAGNDSYLFDADVALGSDTVNDSAGIDTLDFSATAGQSIALNLGLTTAQVVNANLTLSLASASAIENVTGGSLGDTLTGNTLANVLIGGPGNDVLTGVAGNDIYRFDLDEILGADTLNEAGGGLDTLDFTLTTGIGATVDLSLATVQTVAAGRLTLVLGSATTFENVMGGAGNDALTGNTLANVLTGGAGDDILTGGTGSDSYLFDADASLGTDTLVETVTGGTDLLDFTGTSAGVTLDLALATTQVINTNLSLNLQNGAVFENITGGDGADTLAGNSLINTLTGGMGNDSLNGAGNNDSLIGGGGDDALAGGTGNDSYVFNANTALGSDTLVELAGEGIDLITFATTTTKTVTLNLGLTTLQTVATGTLNLTLNAADTFENLTGGSLADTLTGNSLGNMLIGGPGNDMLAGAAGDDVYSYTTSAALGTDTLIEVTGEGADTLDFSLTTTLAVAVNLGSAITQVVNANLSVVLNAVDTFENATGGSLNDTLTGNALANRLVGNAGLDTLAGGAGNDTLDGGLGNDSLQGGSDNDAYLLDTDLVLGTDTITELAGGGIDTLDFSQTTTKSIAVNLGLITPQLVTAGNLTLTLNAADTVEHITGGSLNDTLTGNALANRIDGGGGLDALQGLAGDDTLIGGLGNDSYLFNTGTALGTDTLDESAGGLDTLDFSASTTLGVTVNLGIATTQVVNANLSLILQADNTFENVFGGSLSDWLTGNALANTLLGNDGPDNVSGGAGNDSLNGGLGDDTYRFAAHSALGTDTLNESAGGTDTLDFSGTTSTNVTLNLGTTASQVVNTNLSLVLGLATAFENAIGGGGNDLLTGNTIANVLTGGAGHDTLVGLAGNDILQGGLGDDSYVFAANAALGTDSVVELAGEGLDLLDLSFSTVAVNVNLGVATTQVVNANLSLTLNAADTFEMVIGSSVNDTLTGNSLANVILGGAGNDAIAGLTGRDLLFGGSGNDSLDGGDDEDIVIGGLTTWFNETTKVLDRTATTAIWTEWTRTDLAYASRITNLKNGGGLNGTFKLSSLTVLTDTAAMADTLTGGLSLDWFWQFAGDVVSDLNNGGTETVN